jgi:hypothetical protein
MKEKGVKGTRVGAQVNNEETYLSGRDEELECAFR